MIKLAFIGPNREVIRFSIENKVVTYFDKVWNKGLLIMPLEDPHVRLQVKKMTLSRKSSLSAMGLLIIDANSGKNKEEYDICKTDEEVAELVRRDCTSKGLKEVK